MPARDDVSDRDAARPVGKDLDCKRAVGLDADKVAFHHPTLPMLTVVVPGMPAYHPTVLKAGHGGRGTAAVSAWMTWETSHGDGNPAAAARSTSPSPTSPRTTSSALTRA